MRINQTINNFFAWKCSKTNLTKFYASTKISHNVMAYFYW